MKRILLNHGQHTLVDDTDYKWLNQWRWHCVIQHSIRYAVRTQNLHNGKYRSFRMHREILGLKHGDKKHTDHIDGNGLNNQEYNLRKCTAQQNSFNQKPVVGTSKYRGIWWSNARNRWVVQMRKNRKTQFLKFCKTEQEAIEHYNRMAPQIYGEFARLNKVAHAEGR